MQAFDPQYPVGRETCQLVEAIASRKTAGAAPAVAIAQELGLIPVLRRYDTLAKPGGMAPLILQRMRASGSDIGEKTVLEGIIERFDVPSVSGIPDLELIINSADYRSRARHAHNQALEMLAAIPPEAAAEMPVATALIRAEVLERMGSLAEATAQFESALDSHPEGAWLFRVATGLARCRVALGSPQDAREALRDALHVAIGTSDQSSEAQVRRMLGIVSEACGRPYEAVSWYRGSLNLAREDEDWAGALHDLSRLAALAAGTGDDLGASSYRRESARLRGDLREVASLGPSAALRPEVVANARALLIDLKPFQATDPEADGQQAEEFYREASALRRKQGRPREAIPAYHLALARYLALDSPEGQSACLSGLALSYKALAQDAMRLEVEAMRNSNRSRMGVGGPSSHEEAWAMLAFIGKLADIPIRGEPRRWIDLAIGCHRWALELQKPMGNLSGQANHISNLGQVEEAQGNLDTALCYQKWAMQAHRKDRRVDDVKIDLTTLVGLSKRLGDAPESERWQRQLDEVSNAAGS